jgi:hypothetical protein
MSEPRTHGPARRCSVHRSVVLAFLPVLTLVLLSLGCASQEPGAARGVHLPQGSGKADDFLVVDCLLPGQVRRLGQQLTYLTAGRAVKTSARDCEIRGGEYVAYDRANYATALKVWLPLAEQGDVAAATNVGEIFERGLGVPPDYAAAAQWYRRAAEKGGSRAAIDLGNLYERGLGVPKDPAQALNWYRRAAGLPELSFEVVPGKTAGELEHLRAEIAELRRQLQVKQDELGRARGEVETLKRRLEERRGEADSERAGLARLKQELAEQRATGQSASARATKLESTIADAERRLAARDQDVADLRQALARAEAQSSAQRAGLDREVAALRDKLARAEAESSVQRAGIERLTQQVAQAGPRIELVQVQLLEPPVVVATRDAQARPAATSGDGRAAMTAMLVGRVISSVGVASLTIDQRPEAVDGQSLFRAQVPLGEANRSVRIVARDANGRSGTLEFLLPAVAMPPRDARVDVRRPQEGPVARDDGTPRRPSITLGRYHALVIGNNGYRQLPRLRTAVNDAREIAGILKEQYGFEVTLLTDATRYDILSALNHLRETLTSKDNLLIYYAGHGILDERNRRGYWLPVDAEPNSTANWIANGDITAILNIMEVRQLLLVADSCYAGTLTRSAAGQLEPGMTQEELLSAIQKMAQARSRMVMTSGGIEPVIDSAGGKHSAFAEVFIQVLRSNDGMLLGREVFRRLQIRVAAMAERLSVVQVPEYAPIQFAGHEAGDFVFARAGG